MIAFVTSIGESTTELCAWTLERNGFEVVLLESESSLAEKLKDIYDIARDDFVRVDADIVVNRNLTVEKLYDTTADDLWWVQYLTYDWHKQDTTHGGVQFIKKEALPALRANVDRMMTMERPESELYRISDFHNPRRCDWYPMVMGLNGYKQSDVERIKATKRRRNQYDSYDWMLAERLAAL